MKCVPDGCLHIWPWWAWPLVLIGAVNLVLVVVLLAAVLHDVAHKLKAPDRHDCLSTDDEPDPPGGWTVTEWAHLQHVMREDRLAMSAQRHPSGGA